MYRTKRRILAAVNYSPDGTGGEGAAGGQGAGNGQQGGGAAGGQGAGNGQQGGGTSTGGQQNGAGAGSSTGNGQQGGTDPTKGMVPVGELAEERTKRQALEKTVTDLQAGQKAFQENLLKAFGLGDDKKTPEQLAAAATEATNREKAANAQLAVARLAGKAGGDVNALLDSNSFLRTLTTLDTSKEADVIEAIKAAVKENPALAQGKVPAAGSGDAGRPGGEGGSQISMDELIRSARN